MPVKNQPGSAYDHEARTVYRWPYAARWEEMSSLDKKAHPGEESLCFCFMVRRSDDNGLWTLRHRRVSSFAVNSSAEEQMKALDLILDILIPIEKEYPNLAYRVADFLQGISSENLSEISLKFSGKSATEIYSTATRYMPAVKAKRNSPGLESVCRKQYKASWTGLTEDEYHLYSQRSLAVEFAVRSQPTGEWEPRLRQVMGFTLDNSSPDERMDALELVLDVLIPVYEERRAELSEVARDISGIWPAYVKTYRNVIRGKGADFISYYTGLHPLQIKKLDAKPARPEGAAVSHTAYERFQLYWMGSHGFSVQDIEDTVEAWNSEVDNRDEYSFGEYLFDQGFCGAIWPCYDEFLGAEYPDVGLMKLLLSEKEFEEYLKDVGASAPAKDSGPNELIALAQKAAEAWRGTDTYHQASVIIDALVAELSHPCPSDRISVQTPLGQLTASKVGGTENPGIAVDFYPRGKDEVPSVVIEYTEGYRGFPSDAPKETVQARIHKDSNTEPCLWMDMNNT